MYSRDPSQYVWWLASRSSGIVAFVLISSAVVLGLSMAAKVLQGPGVKKLAVKVHEQIALTALVAIALHGILLLGDPWLNPGPAGIVLPFTMAYRPLFTGLGILAGYLAAGLSLTYYIRRRMKPGLWRRLHRFIAVVYVLAAVHLLGSGSDGASLWLQAVVVVTALPIAYLLATRYFPRRKPTRPPARTLGGEALRAGS